MHRRRIAIVLNGVSARKRFFLKKYLPALQRSFDADVLETRYANHATELAAAAFAGGSYEAIIAAGGDGTLNQVVNGVLGKNTGRKPVVGLVPLGSGNDFARTAGASTDPSVLIRLLETFRPVPTDVGIVTFSSSAGREASRYFINVADVGMGPHVVTRVNSHKRILPTSLAYYTGIFLTFFTFRPVPVNVDAGTWQWSGKVRSLAVANGRYYGHGLCVAPGAATNDRSFGVFICGNVSVTDFIRYSPALKNGRHLDIPEIHYRTASKIHLASEQLCHIEGDGEVFGTLPAVISFASASIDFLM